MTNKPPLPELPQLKLTTFDYNEETGVLDIELEKSDYLNEYVGKELKLDRAATHEEMEKFFVEIIAKAIAGTDGYDLQTESEFAANDGEVAEKTSEVLPKIV